MRIELPGISATRGNVREAMRVRFVAKAAPVQTRPPAVLRAQNLRKVYPARWSLLGRDRPAAKAVDGVTFTLRQGDVLTLLGEPGSGRSTLARVLARDLEASGGGLYPDPPQHLLHLITLLSRYCELQDRLAEVETGVWAPALHRLDGFLAELPLIEAQGLLPASARPRRLARRVRALRRDVQHVVTRAARAADRAAERVRPLLLMARESVDEGGPAREDFLNHYLHARRELRIALARIEGDARTRASPLRRRLSGILADLPLMDNHPTMVSLRRAKVALMDVKVWSSLLSDESLAHLRDDLKAAATGLVPEMRNGVRRGDVERYLANIDARFNLARVPRKRLARFRRAVQRVSAADALLVDPRMSVWRIVQEGLRQRRGRGPLTAREAATREALELAGLVPVTAYLSREFGTLPPEAQSLALLARALARRPKALILDEALDHLEPRSLAATMARIRERLGTAVLVVTGDLETARHVGGTLGVLYHGRIVEKGPTADLLRTPVHPYLRALVRAAPAPTVPPAAPVTGLVSPAQDGAEPVANGCRYFRHCPEAKSLCHERAPDPVLLADGRRFAECHFAPGLFAPEAPTVRVPVVVRDASPAPAEPPEPAPEPYSEVAAVALLALAP